MDNNNERTREEILQNKKYFGLYYNKCAMVRKFCDDIQAGKLLKGISKYAETGELIDTDDEKVSMFFDMLKIDVDILTDHFVDKSKKASYAANKRWEKEKKKDNTNASERMQTHAKKDKDIDKGKDIDKDIDKDAAADEAADTQNVPLLTKCLIKYYDKANHPSRAIVDEILKYYLDSYYRTQGKQHPEIKESAYRDIIFPGLLSIGDKNGNCPYVAEKHDDEETLELYKRMIDAHFETDYHGKCDYNMVHFFSGEVRLIKYREVKGV